jgi:TonB family protein
VILKQLIKIATSVLLVIGMLTVSSESRSDFHCSDQSSSLQAEPKVKPASPAILPSHSGSIRRGVCWREAIKTAQPIYSVEAQKQGIKGVVVVEIIINEKGRVESARSLSGPDALRDAAVEAAKKWRFRVTRIGGKTVKIACALSFTFPLTDSHTKKTRSVYSR